MPRGGRLVGAHRKMNRRLGQAFELQLRIAGLLLACIAIERRVVGSGKILCDCLPPRRRFDQDEAPGLAQADRRRAGGERKQPGDEIGLHGIGSKPANVTPPAHQLGELRLESRVEARRPLLGFDRHAGWASLILRPS